MWNPWSELRTDLFVCCKYPMSVDPAVVLQREIALSLSILLEAWVIGACGTLTPLGGRMICVYPPNITLALGLLFVWASEAETSTFGCRFSNYSTTFEEMKCTF
jgi:hypothetical protein